MKNEYEELENNEIVTEIAFKICALIFIIGSTFILWDWITSNQVPEPAWWLQVEQMILGW